MCSKYTLWAAKQFKIYCELRTSWKKVSFAWLFCELVLWSLEPSSWIYYSQQVYKDAQSFFVLRTVTFWFKISSNNASRNWRITVGESCKNPSSMLCAIHRRNRHVVTPQSVVLRYTDCTHVSVKLRRRRSSSHSTGIGRRQSGWIHWAGLRNYSKYSGLYEVAPYTIVEDD